MAEITDSSSASIQTTCTSAKAKTNSKGAYKCRVLENGGEGMAKERGSSTKGRTERKRQQEERAKEWAKLLEEKAKQREAKAKLREQKAKDKARALEERREKRAAEKVKGSRIPSECL